MHHRWSIKRRSTWALVTVPVLTLASLSVAASATTTHGHSAAQAAAATERYVASRYTVAPNKANMLDCNGWSKAYTAIIHGFGDHCVDPHGLPGASMVNHCPGHAGSVYSTLGRFADNCHYVGHDEPSVKFISKAPGSAYQMTYFMQLPTDPAAAPTDTGSVTHYAELSPAPWFGLPICDPASYPIKPCKPHSDLNSGKWSNKNAAGSAFMELQFYPPGFAPFQDDVSCNATKWCAAMTIDSLESTFLFKHVNGNCVEPANFAYLQTNGVPAGPPSPQRTNSHTFTPNAHTLKMNSGDVLKVSISDPLTGTKAGFTARVADLTTHQTGYMIASAHNGFMDTSIKNCKGTRFTFHAEYNSAKQGNQVPWAALEGGVLMEQEIGHSEICTSLSTPDATISQGFSDLSTSDTCTGGSDTGGSGEGSGGCTPDGLGGFICSGAETQGPSGPQGCPSDDTASGALCEYADGTCIPAGSRNVTISGHTVSENSPLNFCEANLFQNGDLDFDGVPYQTTSWPDGTTNTPTSFRYAGPFTKGGATYPFIQFETDVPGSEIMCNPDTAPDAHATCLVPPVGDSFYPYWSLAKKGTQPIGSLFTNACIWNFGNLSASTNTLTAFHGDHQYGIYDFGRPFGTNTSKVLKNPETTFTGCSALHEPK